MDQKAIERGWLLISLSPKRQQKKDGEVTKKHKRLPLGDKGLGRLGTMKLGKCLSVETRHSPKEAGWLVTFQWSDIKSGTLLDEVPIKWQRVPANGQTGTTVRIFGLNGLESWKGDSRKKRLELRLSSLISPFDEANNFEVSLDYNGRPVDLVRISTKLRDTAAMTFDYDWNGQRLLITGKLKLIWFRKKKEGYDQFIGRDGGVQLFKALEENVRLGNEFKLGKPIDPSWFLTLEKEIDASDIQFNEKDGINPGPFSGSLDYFELDTDIRLPQSVFGHASDYRAYVKSLAQIYVYRDGFGIRMPNDWLRLGSAWTSAAGYYSLKPSNVIGFFRVSVADNPQLEEKSDREGFTDNESWRGFSTLTSEIKDSINEALNQSGRTASKFLNEKTGIHATEEESKNDYGELLNQLEGMLGQSESLSQYFEQHAKSRFQGLSQVAAAARVVFLNLKDTVDPRTKAKQLLELVERLQTDLDADNSQIEKLTKDLIGQKKLAAIIRRRIDDFQERSQLLYEMVGVGLSAQALAHDVPAMLHHLEDQSKSISKTSRGSPIDKEKLIATADDIKTSVDAVEQMIDFVRPMLRGRRLSRKRAKLSDFLRSFFELRGARLKTRGIKWHIEENGMRDFEIGFNPGRFTQVLDNLTTNSEYWIEHFYGNSSQEGRIDLEIRDPELIFYDNGKGIRPDLEESLFELFTTGKEGNEGNGLGLFITRQLLLRDNCTISVDSARNKHNRLFRFIVNFSGAKK